MANVSVPPRCGVLAGVVWPPFPPPPELHAASVIKASAALAAIAFLRRGICCLLIHLRPPVACIRVHRVVRGRVVHAEPADLLAHQPVGELAVRAWALEE